MDNWLPLKGLWKDKGLFGRVIVEGIYPLHPISTYMLTGLSGYLQNRSSLTLVNKHITALSTYELLENKECPLVLPEQLLDGDLYSEMLVAEQEGRQLSRHCIRYDNILRKSEVDVRKIYKKLGDYLVTRGYGFDIVTSTLNQVISLEEYDGNDTGVRNCTNSFDLEHNNTEENLDKLKKLAEKRYALICKLEKDKLKVWYDEGIPFDIMNKYQVRYDPFSNRIVFPIRDNNGEIINVKGRTLDIDYKAKKIRKYTHFYIEKEG
jgi:hypothetical protein